MYSNSKIKKYKYLGFSRIPQRVAHAAGMPQEASQDIYYYFLKIIKILLNPSKGRPCRRHASRGLSRYILLFSKKL
jgi:hypothetical protein